MNFSVLWPAIIMGIIEGITEFLPISSTGHLIVIGDLLGFQGPPGKAFEISIQLGAIMAVVVVFFRKLVGIGVHMFTRFEERYYATNILLAFLPAMILGATLYKTVTEYLFSPLVVAIALIVGGIAIILIERIRRIPTMLKVEEIGPLGAVIIGFGQVLAMIPGTSRSGATIIAALTLGVERKVAAEFSFILAIPTMLAATVFTLYKNWAMLDLSAFRLIAVGFVVAFIVALITVKIVLATIQRMGFSPFGWYRIGLGCLILLWLAVR